jgi:Flp pilus assembly pilin Flp
MDPGVVERPGHLFYGPLPMHAQEKRSLVMVDGWRRGRWCAHVLHRLAAETDGQDMIEYALITAFIGFSGAAAWNAMQTSLGNAYDGFTDGVWSLWEPDDPVGGGS